MLSGRLVHLIESHWEDIISRVIARIHRDPQLDHFRSAVEADMRESGRVLLRDLGHWLIAGNQDEIVHHYERLGALRFQDGMPLHEAVRWSPSSASGFWISSRSSSTLKPLSLYMRKKSSTAASAVFSTSSPFTW